MEIAEHLLAFLVDDVRILVVEFLPGKGAALTSFSRIFSVKVVS